MPRRRYLLITALAGLVLALFAACSDRESSSGNPTAAADTPTPAPTATPTVTPTPVPGREEAEKLASTPAFFIYVIGSGDTLHSVADMFDGIEGGTDPDFAEQIRTLNELPSTGSLPVRYEIAIPLRLPDAASLFQANSINEAIRAGATEDVTPFQVPGQGVIDGLRGELALYRIEIEDGSAPGEGRGYFATYSRTDRVAIKGGELDRQAKNVEPAFVTAGGSLAARLVDEHPTAFVWRDHPFEYYIYVLADGLPGAGILAAGMQPAK